MSERPFGYKPVRHRPCRTTVAWVKQHVTKVHVAHAGDVLMLDGETPKACTLANFYCPTCEETVKGFREVTIE